MTCQDLIAVLADYLDSVLGPDAIAELERHLAACEPCRAYLATYRRTRTLATEVNRTEMPDEMKDRLRRLLLEKLR